MKQIDCGDSHSVCLDTRGRVWIFGSNIFGQINGFPYKNPLKYKNSKNSKNSKHSKQNSLTSASDGYQLSILPRKVKQSQTGSRLSLTEEGLPCTVSTVFSDNSDNASSSLKHIFEPILVDCFDSDAVITDVKCMQYCTFVTDSKCNVYCWGKITSDCAIVANDNEKDLSNFDLIDEKSKTRHGVLKIEFADVFNPCKLIINVGYSHMFMIHRKEKQGTNVNVSNIDFNNIECFGSNSGFECLTNARALTYDNQVLTNLKLIDRGMMDSFLNRNEKIIDIVCGRECTLVVTFTLAREYSA